MQLSKRGEFYSEKIMKILYLEEHIYIPWSILCFRTRDLLSNNSPCPSARFTVPLSKTADSTDRQSTPALLKNTAKLKRTSYEEKKKNCNAFSMYIFRDINFIIYLYLYSVLLLQVISKNRCGHLRRSSRIREIRRPHFCCRDVRNARYVESGARSR